MKNVKWNEIAEEVASFFVVFSSAFLVVALLSSPFIYHNLWDIVNNDKMLAYAGCWFLGWNLVWKLSVMFRPIVEAGDESQ